MRGWLAALALAVACGDADGSGADEAFLAGRYAEAARAWAEEARAGSAEAWGLAGEAALRARDYPGAVDAWRELAAALPARRLEAVEGLRRVAAAAALEGSLPGLREAATALAALAPEAPLARYAPRLAAQDGADGLAWFPGALAGAGDPAEAAALLRALAERREGEAGCRPALDAWGAALRRAPDAEGREEALAGFTRCGLALGDAALLVDAAAEAEGWYRRVVEVTPPRGEASRRAQLGVGDARARQGDLLGAALSWQSVSGTADDSLAAVAAQRLNSLADAAGQGDFEGQ